MTGEELVTKVNGVFPDHVVIEDPLVLIMQQGKNGITINFMPWTIIAEGPINVENSGIVARYAVPQEVSNNYIQNTTGLQIVSGAQAPQILKG